MSEICPACGRDSKKWEYKVYLIEAMKNTRVLEKDLNDLAAEGWQPIRWLSDFPHPWARHIIFERPKRVAARFYIEDE